MKPSNLKAEDVRAMSAEELSAAVSERKKELMELRFKNAVGGLEKPHRVRQLRREVAQLLTLRQRQEESNA